jgi:hypothetical protein
MPVPGQRPRVIHGTQGFKITPNTSRLARRLPDDGISETEAEMAARQPGIVQRTEQPYNVIDMDRQLEVEAGFPVAAPVTGDGQVLAAVLPAGRYATLWHTGHPDELLCATRTLLDWAAQQGLAWDVMSTPDGERWGCRLEIYHDEPGQDMNEWETELAFKLAD